MTYLLCSGFGFDNGYWKNLIPLLDGEYEFFDSSFNSFERKDYVGIGHSLGFLKLNNSGIKFQALVGLQGFLNFCSGEPSRNSFLQKNLNRMMMNCERDTERFLEFFRNLCGYEERVEKNFSKEELRKDLESMKYSYEHCSVPTLIIGSEQDKIVEPRILQDNFSNNPSIQLKYVDEVNHTLGFSKSAEVFKIIKAFLKEI